MPVEHPSEIPLVSGRRIIGSTVDAHSHRYDLCDADGRPIADPLYIHHHPTLPLWRVTGFQNPDTEMPREPSWTAWQASPREYRAAVREVYRYFSALSLRKP